MKRSISTLPFFLFAAPLLAQSSAPGASPSGTPDSTTDAAAAAAVAGIVGVYGACCIIQALFTLAFVVGWILTAIWVMNDAKNRNSENAQLVTILTWIPPTWWIGLIVHLVTRPKGNLVQCPHCQKKRLENSPTCPHCHQP